MHEQNTNLNSNGFSIPMASTSAKEIAIKAVQIDSQIERESFLANECVDDPELRERVDNLIRAFDEGDAPSGTNSEQADLTIESGPRTENHNRGVAEEIGQQVGNFKLLQQIGEGGFGVVYMAEQTEPVRRKVALKIVKPGMDTKEVVARFEAERQALALMEHPNIAKVLDGGVTESGRPFFVMELVKGIPITEFCDKNKMTTNDRLKLFIAVCRAIHHAHQKGIIHRDIKPSNVMVTLHDGTPVPKVIDFGVSKALTQQLTDKTLFTAYGQMVGTPTYMSPEQAEMSGLDIDIRTDIYSLGVLLYELLTGSTPLAKEDVKSATYDQLQRMIKEEEAQRPSTRLSTLGEEATVKAENRGTDLRRLAALLKGDLDWIVIKTLEKDRNRRYDTAVDLADDLESYLDQRPVDARPPSMSYKTLKLLRRNKLRVAITAVTILVLVISGISTLFVIEGEEKQKELTGLINQAEQEQEELKSQIEEDKADEAKEQWARDIGIPELEQFIHQKQFVSALKQAKELQDILPDDQALAELVAKASKLVTFNLTPPDTKVFVRDWQSTSDKDWLEIPASTNEAVQVPHGPVQIRYEPPKRTPLETISGFSDSPSRSFLSEVTVPAEMVVINGAQKGQNRIEHDVQDFLADRLEVSNAQFAEFVEDGGYENATFWKHEFHDDNGQTISRDDAIARFVDQTGMPGPAHWENGTYPDEQENHPVTGVSWYEAAAYAEYRGKTLPTVTHWERTAAQRDHWIAPMSNFTTGELATCGQFRGLGYFGVVDIAGNASEWCSNAFGETERAIRGGSFKDPAYLFKIIDHSTPMSRLRHVGFRCVKYLTEPVPECFEKIEPLLTSDFEDVPIETIQQYKRFYEYDKSTDLHVEITSTDLTPKEHNYRQELITIDAAYGGERFDINLYFPRDSKLPIHPILLFPGADALGVDVFDLQRNKGIHNLVIAMTEHGHAVCIPIYKGMYGRKQDPGNGNVSRRRHRVQMVQDIGHAIDYLETRSDITVRQLSYIGLSFGGYLGPIHFVNEPRIQSAVLLGTGVSTKRPLSEYDAKAYLSHVTIPIIMINGYHDPIFPYTISQKPYFDHLGSEEKEVHFFEAGHIPPFEDFIDLIHAWHKKHGYE